jgi:two-component system LytT family response regulator
MNAIIIDDEKQAREALAALLETYCNDIVLVGEAENGEEGLELIRTAKPDLVFLDVEMPMLDGFGVLERLSNIDFALIFVTAFNQYAERAFEFSALDFLRKPVDIARLLKAVNKAASHKTNHTVAEQLRLLLERVGQQGNPVATDHRVAFAMHDEIVFSWVRNVIWIEADTNMCWIKLADHEKRLYIAKNIGEYERLFEPYQDLKRVHRSFVAHRNHVKKYLREDGELLMSDGKSIPISSNKKEEIMRWLG